MKNIKKITALAIMAAMGMAATARDAQGIKIYLNPGHGGYDSNDRNVVIEPYKSGDPAGYWESKSNLAKGLHLRDMLTAKGYTVVMSRTTNTTADDLNLSTIVELSNESGADMFFSIHSNATGTSARRNFPLMLYRGWDNEAEKPQDRELCFVLNKYLLQNKATYWTSTNLNVRGDWSFYPSWNGAGLGALRGQKPTAMLSEGSFHDYIPEAYRLMNSDFCWLEAWHFRKTVDEFYGVPGVDYGVVAGRLNDNRFPRAGDYIMFGDDKLATVQGAKVELLDQGGNVVDTYITDKVDINGFYLFKNVAPGTYKVRTSVETHLPCESAELKVVADEVTFCNLQLTKVRDTPPAVVSYSPVWAEGQAGVLCNTPIVFDFNWDMDAASTEAAFNIQPAVEGTFTWENLNCRLVFTPSKPYEISTRYTVTLGTGAKHAGGMAMQQPLQFSFETSDRNFMEIIGSFPKEGDEVHYQNATIEFRFDKHPNVSSLNKQITCTDAAGNAVAFNQRKKTNSKAGDPYGFFRIPLLKDLEPGQTYNLHLVGEFADKDGLTIKEPVDIKFTATDASQKAGEKPVVLAVTDAAAFAYDAEGSANIAAASVAAASDNLFDGAAVSFAYQFSADEGGEARYAYTSPENQTAGLVNNGDVVAVHVNGDLTNNAVYLELTSDVSTLYVPVCNMDFLGWRYIEVPVAVEGASAVTGVKVVQQPSQMSHKGSFGLDNIVMVKSAGVDDITVGAGTGITVYPNPVSEYLIANGDALITKVQLVGLNGAVAATAAGNVVNVSDVPDGTYIALVYTATSRVARKVSVKH